MNYKKLLGSAAINQAVDYMEKDPLNNIPKILNIIRRFTSFDYHERGIKKVESELTNPDSNWYEFAQNMLSTCNVEVVKKFVSNFVINATLIGRKINIEMGEKHGCNIPWAILMDPTSACNLSCEGCWAADYDRSNSLSFDTMDRIIREGKELGIYMYVLSGGEPFVEKDKMIMLAEKHRDCSFLSFTNGTMINQETAQELKRVANFALAISVDGFEELSDKRRGEGTYKQLDQTMDILRQQGVPFGFSTTYHRYNTESVISEEYIDLMIEKGCLFGWYFTYMPIGSDGTPELLATPEQRAHMYQQIQKFRNEKPIFLIDFWNDGEFTHGCIAGGKHYLHINANGDVEPCAFIHYANVNIKEYSLLEALKSPLFLEYQERQPFDNNMLRPCPLLDKPEELYEMVKKSKAYSTHFHNKEPVEVVTNRCQKISREWAEKADEIWRKKQDYISSSY